MGDFFAELRRRHIYRVGAAYVVVAWGITQVVDVLSQVFALPAWIGQPVLIVLAIGLPITLIAAWLIEGKAQDAVASAMRSPASTIDYALFGAMAVVIGLISYQQFTPSDATLVDATASAVADEIVQDIADRLPNSIAVLPFENLSPDPDDAYFAAGVHDEILSKLAKLRELTVIARASVMRYADSDLPIPQIAQELNVEMVMAGTVRYAGDQVRVTAQLIDGTTNVPVWTTEDEGDLSDIFAIQSDIAMNIANSLQAQFSVEEQESIEAIPTDSPEAYTLYLRALTLAAEGHRGAGNSATRAAVQELLDRATRLDPEFAMAFAWKAFTYAMSRVSDLIAEENRPAFRSEMDRLIVENANTALSLDPRIGLAHAALGRLYLDDGQLDMALVEAEEALRLSPNDTEVVVYAARILGARVDQRSRAIALVESAAQRDPSSEEVHQSLGEFFISEGRLDEAVASLQKCLEIESNGACATNLAIAEFLRGNEQATLDAVRYSEQITNRSTFTTSVNAYLYGRLGQADDAQRVYQQFSEMAREGYVEPLYLIAAFVAIGDYDAAYNVVAENLDVVNEAVRLNTFNDPVFEEPRWVELRNQMVPQ